MNIKIFVFYFFLSFGLIAQEVVVFPGQKAIQIEAFTKSKVVDTLEIPFFDDFSDTADFTKNFVDNFVSFSNTQSVLPPSIATVCFDAVDNNQDFYYSYSQSGIADYLTSKPINLYYPGETTIYLSFYYQATGLLDSPEKADSLVLQFYSPTDEEWTTVWTKSNGGDISFKQVILQISEEKYLQKGFKLRFYNRVSMPLNSKPSLVSNCDYWFVDYIYLNKNRTENDTIRKDIAFQNVVDFKFNDYQQIPYSHYKNTSVLNHNFFLKFRNNDNKLRTVDSMYFVFHDNKQVLENDTLFLGSSNFGEFNNFYRSGDNVSFQFPNTSAEYLDFNLETKLVTDSYDSIKNNTINQHKRMSVTYAYDDGTAENGYGLFGDGTISAFVAQKYFTYETDYLTGIQVYFNKTKNNFQPYYFHAHVWENDEQTGKPDVIVRDQNDFEVNHSKLNEFQIYKFDEPVEVTDTFYIGWKKVVDDFMNVGMDLNSTDEQYKFETSYGYWRQSSLNGVLMLRPIFGDVDLVKNTEHINDEVLFNVYPNPAQEYISIQFDNIDYEQKNIRIIDMSGRIIKTAETFSDFEKIDVSVFQQGLYILEIRTQNKVYRQKFVKN
ncbi:MAG: T9SS type A sorting domain-containing protein [Bacteroidota bacterium]|nr:T9SS type A sorting domain-containing protein [Bacteroidota bacterium]